MNKIQGANVLKEMIFIPASEQTEKKLRAVAYARVSSNSEDQINSFESQVNYYNKLESEDFEMLEVYADEGISGTSLDRRTEFQRMLDDARLGKIDVIITKALSRFARNSLDTIKVVRELTLLGVSVRFEKENIDTAKLTSENILSLYASLAERESINISENVKSGTRNRMAQGEFVPTSAPYGYKIKNQVLEVYEPEANIIKRIYNEYLGGKGATLIVRGLNEESIPRKDGVSNWRVGTIHAILRNERYIGDMLLQKTFTENVVPFTKKRNKGELKMYYVRNTHEPIISDLEFELVKILLETKSIKNRKENNTSIFARMMKCSHCGTTLRVREISGKTYWVCRNKNDYITKEPCNAELIRQDIIEKAFINMVNKLKQNYKTMIQPMVADLERLDDIIYRGNADLKQLNKDISKVSEQKLTMTGLISKNTLDPAIFLTQIDELDKKIRKLKEQKNALNQLRKSNNSLDKTLLISDILNDMGKYLTEMDEDIFTEIVEKIEVYDKKEITFCLINGMKLVERTEYGKK